ncbi:MAG: VOC family protein [Bacteroidota bacterium]
MSVPPIPEGYSRVCPYLMVDEPEILRTFLMAVFDGEVIHELKNPDGTLAHLEVRIVDTVIMAGQARDGMKATSSTLYVYVEDVDLTYQRAIDAGAQSFMAPNDAFYGDRACAVNDPSGNQWWIASQVKDVPTEEAERLMAEQRGLS